MSKIYTYFAESHLRLETGGTEGSPIAHRCSFARKTTPQESLNGRAFIHTKLSRLPVRLLPSWKGDPLVPTPRTFAFIPTEVLQQCIFLSFVVLLSDVPLYDLIPLPVGGPTVPLVLNQRCSTGAVLYFIDYARS